jgi:hypothetical protein
MSCSGRRDEHGQATKPPKLLSVAAEVGVSLTMNGCDILDSAALSTTFTVGCDVGSSVSISTQFQELSELKGYQRDEPG